MLQTYCLVLLFGLLLLASPVVQGAERTYVSACWQKTFEGSRESRAKRTARRACQDAGREGCQIVDVFCFDPEHCFATVESCQEYEGRGSNNYRALRHALRQCQVENSHCRINSRTKARTKAAHTALGDSNS